MIDMTHKHIYMAAVILLLTSVPATAGQGKTAAMTFIDNAMTPRTAAMGGISSGTAPDAGYHYGSNKNGLLSYASIGAGLSLYGITVDAAYLIAPARSAMHNTFMVGIGYRF